MYFFTYTIKPLIRLEFETGEIADTVSKALFAICTFLFLSFRRVLNVMYSFLGNSPASEF